MHEDPASELMTGCPAPFLVDLVDGLRREGWEFVSLDEAMRRVDGGPVERPFAVLTFDDGYRNSMSYALAVLERLQAPFIVYVPTGALTRELYAWWLALRALFRSHETVTIECMGLQFSCDTLASKVAALAEVSCWVHQDYRRKFELAPTFATYGISLEAINEAYFLNADELREFARRPLVTIGAHTTSHAALITLETARVRAEMADNKIFLEQLLDRQVAHFAYPYGNERACGEREMTIAREVGFLSAVTIEDSPVFPKHRNKPEAMPRIFVRPNETLASLYYKMIGLAWVVSSRRFAKVQR